MKTFLREMLTDDKNYYSLSRVSSFTALILSSGAFVWLLATDKLTEWFFTGYMLAWAGAYLGSKTIDRIKPNQQ